MDSFFDLLEFVVTCASTACCVHYLYRVLSLKQSVATADAITASSGAKGFALKIYAFCIWVGTMIFVYGASQQALWWYPKNWGSSDEEGYWHSTKSELCFLIGFVGSALLLAGLERLRTEASLAKSQQLRPSKSQGR